MNKVGIIIEPIARFIPRLLIVPLLILITFPTSAAQDKKNYILWITWEQRPIFLTNPNNDQLEGIYQDIINYLHASSPLDQYKQKQVFVNHSRFNRVAQSPDNCYLGWSTYEDLRIETRPITMIKPWVIWTSEKQEATFGKPNSLISLEKLIEDPNIKVGIIKYFTYSQTVLDLIAKHEGNPSLIVANTSAIEINPRTLSAGRMDAFLGNPGQMQRRKTEPEPTIKFIQYGISEDNQHREMLVSCANDEKGRFVVQKVNQLINRNPTAFYNKILSFHDKWVGEITPSFLKQFKEKVHPIDFQP